MGYYRECLFYEIYESTGLPIFEKCWVYFGEIEHENQDETQKSGGANE